MVAWRGQKTLIVGFFSCAVYFGAGFAMLINENLHCHTNYKLTTFSLALLRVVARIVQRFKAGLDRD